MLTLAEEEGLAGLALASRVQHALYRLAPAELVGLIERLRAGALSQHVVYLRDGEVEPIRILPAPLTVLPDQLAYIHRVSLAVQSALKRLPALYLQDFTVREILRLPDAEEPGFASAGARASEAHNPIFGRLDALVDFTSPMWKDTLRFVEPNLTGIGGVHMVPDVRTAARGHRRAGAAGRGRGARPRSWARTCASCWSGRCSTTRRPSGPARRSASSSPSTPATGRTSRRELARLAARPLRPHRDARRSRRSWSLQRRRGVLRGPAGGPGVPGLRRGRPAGARGRGRRRRADAGAPAGEPDGLVDRGRPRPEGLLGGADRSAALPAVLHRRGAAASFSGTSCGPACSSDRRTVLPDGRHGQPARVRARRATRRSCSSRTARTAATAS